VLLPSHASDSTAESCWRWRCQGNVGRGVMSLLRQRWSWRDVIAEVTWSWRDVATEVTWSWRDVTTESC
jgi:hypothetical protein